jgi:hypothetical protein
MEIDNNTVTGKQNSATKQNEKSAIYIANNQHNGKQNSSEFEMLHPSSAIQ